MRSYIILSLSIFFLIIGVCYANSNDDDESCKTQIKTYLKAIEVTENLKGEEQKLAGLTKEDIEKMLREKTYCEVSQEIFRRITSVSK